MRGQGGRRLLKLIAAVACLAAGCAPQRSERSFDPDSIPDAYLRPSGALMWPGASRAFYVTPRGDLYDGEWQVSFDPEAGGAAADPPRAIAAEDRWLPVLHWSRRAGPVRFDFEAAALGAPVDSSLIVSLAVQAENTGGAPQPAALTVRLGSPDPVPAFFAFDAPPEPGAGIAWAGSEPGAACAWSDRGEGAGAGRSVRWTLAPGERREARFAFPAYPMEAASLRSWARTPHSARLRQARGFWTGEVRAGMEVELGDPEVERALDAALVVLLACRERRGADWVPIAGPFHYRDVWLRDGARAIQALALSGHTRIARELARGMLRFQWPQGAFLSQRGQLDGTGQALWLIEQALLSPAPDDSLRRFAAAALAGFRWMERQRAMGRATGAPFGPMLPYGDPNDGEGVRAQLVGNDAWALAGYRATARLLRAAGESAAAAEVEDSLVSYRSDFERALARTGRPDLPPSWQLVGRDWGNLAAGYPCQVFPPWHPRLEALADRIWAVGGGAGLAWYGTADSLHYYLGADLGTWALLAGRRGEADSVLAALLHWRTASGGAGEMFSRRGDYGVNLPPHATSAAALVTLVRNCLLIDDGDTLRLTLGARDRWWSGARLRRAPTRWGLVDLEFRRDGQFAVWQWTPVPVWTVLALPAGTRVAAGLDAPLGARRRGREVIAPPGTKSARVAIAPAEGR
ncbi:MAG TPA: hypothetical protein VGK89_12315 [Candidatus Eisenbacteria bacterium]|jgi:hypothetical protein